MVILGNIGRTTKIDFSTMMAIFMCISNSSELIKTCSRNSGKMKGI